MVSPPQGDLSLSVSWQQRVGRFEEGYCCRAVSIRNMCMDRYAVVDKSGNHGIHYGQEMGSDSTDAVHWTQ